MHHNPTPGPADEKWLYGHNWVALAWLETQWLMAVNNASDGIMPLPDSTSSLPVLSQ